MADQNTGGRFRSAIVDNGREELHRRKPKKNIIKRLSYQDEFLGHYYAACNRI